MRRHFYISTSSIFSGLELTELLGGRADNPEVTFLSFLGFDQLGELKFIGRKPLPMQERSLPK